MTAPIPGKNIFLIGYRCTGKTSVGRDVAKKIGWRFVDADDLLMENSGETVTEIVSRGGWELFRKLEKETMKTICQKGGQVVATGGGVVTDGENIEEMKRSGAIVWLRANPETIMERMVRDARTGDLRPSLTNQDLTAEIAETLRERLPLYSAATTLNIDTEGKTLSEVSDEVVVSLSGIGYLE
jgi:shikimate kinase